MDLVNRTCACAWRLQAWLVAGLEERFRKQRLGLLIGGPARFVGHHLRGQPSDVVRTLGSPAIASTGHCQTFLQNVDVGPSLPLCVGMRIICDAHNAAAACEANAWKEGLGHLLGHAEQLWTSLFLHHPAVCLFL
eukprot:Skav213345  [mRNA]  locus=scaffold3041:3423:8681:+ [translate_table: standard]